jgi:hypothetical protein
MLKSKEELRDQYNNISTVKMALMLPECKQENCSSCNVNPETCREMLMRIMNKWIPPLLNDSC